MIQALLHDFPFYYWAVHFLGVTLYISRCWGDCQTVTSMSVTLPHSHKQNMKRLSHLSLVSQVPFVATPDVHTTPLPSPPTLPHSVRKRPTLKGMNFGSGSPGFILDSTTYLRGYLGWIIQPLGASVSYSQNGKNSAWMGVLISNPNVCVVAKGFPHTSSKQCSNTIWAPYNSTQFTSVLALRTQI